MNKSYYLIGCLLGGLVQAAEQAGGSAAARANMAQVGDPYLPPAARQPSQATPPSGAALQAIAVEKLRRRFEAADISHSGTLTEEQARQAGLGFVAEHFKRIDVQQRGRISFDDLRLYMRERGANL
ncbi:EF-hand domain-containing protein [Chitinimonas naiadis]